MTEFFTVVVKSQGIVLENVLNTTSHSGGFGKFLNFMVSLFHQHELVQTRSQMKLMFMTFRAVTIGFCEGSSQKLNQSAVFVLTTILNSYSLFLTNPEILRYP